MTPEQLKTARAASAKVITPPPAEPAPAPPVTPTPAPQAAPEAPVPPAPPVSAPAPSPAEAPTPVSATPAPKPGTIQPPLKPAETPPPPPVSPPDTTAGPVVTPPDTTVPPAEAGPKPTFKDWREQNYSIGPNGWENEQGKQFSDKQLRDIHKALYPPNARASKPAESPKPEPAKQGSEKTAPAPTPAEPVKYNVAQARAPWVKNESSSALQWAKDNNLKAFRVRLRDLPGVKGRDLRETTITVDSQNPDEKLAIIIANTPGATSATYEPAGGNPNGIKARTVSLGPGEAPPKAPGQEAEAPAAGLPTTTPEIPDWMDSVLDKAVRKVPPSLREDARQEVAAEAFKALERFDPSKSQTDKQAFVNQRAQGAAVDYMRKNSKLERGVSRSEVDKSKAAGEETPQSKTVSMPEAAEDIFSSTELSPEKLAEVNERIDVLSPEQREKFKEIIAEIRAERGGTPPPKPPEEAAPTPKGSKPLKPPLKQSPKAEIQRGSRYDKSTDPIPHQTIVRQKHTGYTGITVGEPVTIAERRYYRVQDPNYGNAARQAAESDLEVVRPATDDEFSQTQRESELSTKIANEEAPPRKSPFEYSNVDITEQGNPLKPAELKSTADAIKYFWGKAKDFSGGLPGGSKRGSWSNKPIAKQAAWWVGPKGEEVDVNSGDIATHPAWAAKIMGTKGKDAARRAYYQMMGDGWVRVRQNNVDSTMSALDKDHYMLAVDKAARYAAQHGAGYIRVDTDEDKGGWTWVDLKDVGEFLSHPREFIHKHGEPPPGRE